MERKKIELRYDVYYNASEFANGRNQANQRPKRGRVTEIDGQPANEAFVRDLRRALYHLYDPAELRNSPLVKLLGLQSKGPLALRDVLTDAITRLKPGTGMSPESDTWRTYRTLSHRFVEQFSQAQVASNLGLSIRQMRRLESRALRTLADALWSRYDLQASYTDQGLAKEALDEEPQASTAEPVATPPVQELEWLGRSLPSEPADVGELVNAALKTVEPLLRTLDVQITSRLPNVLPRVLIQVEPIRQALLVVLTEAIRSGPHGQAIIEAQADADQVAITVSNQPVELTATAKLDIARQLLALSGGRLETPSEQSVFIARLLLPSTEQICVLFIDDNADTLQLYRRYLAGTRYSYIGVRDPEQAIALAETTAPRLILQDIMLPGVDGWELLGRLRTHPLTQHIPVIVCSILPQEQLALTLGAAAFLLKPINRESLLAVLDRQVATVEKESR